MYNSLFWKDLLERVISTMAQALLGYVGAASFTPLAFAWGPALVAVAVAGAVCALKAFIAVNATKNEPTVSPASLVKDDRGSGGANLS